MRVALVVLGFAVGMMACSAETQPCQRDPVTNPAMCPAAWADARSLCDGKTACTPSTDRCAYVGAGDPILVTPDGLGCLATAVAQCHEVDGGTGEWHCAQ